MADSTKIILLSDGESWGGFDPDLIMVIEITEEGMEELQEGLDLDDLDRKHVLGEQTLAEAMATTYFGEDHPRYDQWLVAVKNGETVLGLKEWVELNPEVT